MCGIAGIWSPTAKISDLSSALSKIGHRGPDASGEIKLRQNLYLGHKRLSIIDLSGHANQPMISPCKDGVLVYNGEIYNYLDLKKRYLQHVEFHTHSDTEVLLHLLLLKGEAILNELDGMFAFAFYRQSKNELLCVRDHLGIKPFYYYLDGDVFCFGSELKALFSFPGVPRKIDLQGVYEFLRTGFVYNPDTGFRNIKKLGPGQYLKICCLLNSGIEAQFVQYWKPTISKNDSTPIGRLIRESVNRQMVSDVPVGLFFSGGVDSALILSLIKKKIRPIIAKSSQFEMKQAGMADDFYYASRIASLLGVKLDIIPLPKSESSLDLFLDEVNMLSQRSEELISDYTYIPSRLLSRAACKLGYKVMLSGLGADEIFGGYPRYKLLIFENIYKFINRLIPRIILHQPFFAKKLERLEGFFCAERFVEKYSRTIGYFSAKEVVDLVGRDGGKQFNNKLETILSGFETCSNFKKAMLLDWKGFLEHNFAVADKSSMQESIEVRVPLATKELFQWGFNASANQLISFIKTKKVLKNLLTQNLPRRIVNRKKAGFNPPLDKKILLLGKAKIEMIFDENGLYNFINSSVVYQLIHDHFSGKANHTYKLFQLLYLSYWIKNNNFDYTSL